ncbi:alkaline phosphatase [Geodermatophilus telluris]|uniref:Alkaline phosphatase n=1 Tax=Geodermatophilus telluris TaxID=1190417 RepID=A0A1G6K016_9ACTN|nr:alkaline phosphatase [Geodermatophilus telluris]SDC23985.1 alkaline phosphatase [Geodermatophilus telluris]
MSESRTGRRWRTAGLVAVAGGTLALLPLTGALAGAEDPGGDGGQGSGHPRSVIFVNGDGMGPAHREAARLDQEGFDGQLAMDELPVAGLQTTDARDPEDTVTDSAAAASAWATGVKTYNGAISVDVDGEPLPTLGQQAEEAGLAGGIVTTAQVTDATPAAFFATSTDRAAQDDIARQYLEVSRPEVILGGGEDWWLPAGDEGTYPPRAGDEEDPEVSRSTQGDLVAQAQAQGYQYVSTAEEFAAADSGLLLGLFANEEMFQQRPEGEGDEFDPVVSLADMTTTALDVLSQDEDGFFLVVEEEGVDEMSHDNNGTRMLEAMRSLEAAVDVARAYVAEHPDTLLIVTGDHECGGLTIEDVDAEDESGPGGTLPQETAVEGETVSGEDGPFTVAGTDGAHDFALDWTTTAHTGVPTVVTADGPGSEELVGYYPNTHLHDVMSGVLFG